MELIVRLGGAGAVIADVYPALIFTGGQGFRWPVTWSDCSGSMFLVGPLGTLVTAPLLPHDAVRFQILRSVKFGLHLQPSLHLAIPASSSAAARRVCTVPALGLDPARSRPSTCKACLMQPSWCCSPEHRAGRATSQACWALVHGALCGAGPLSLVSGHHTAVVSLAALATRRHTHRWARLLSSVGLESGGVWPLQPSSAWGPAALSHGGFCRFRAYTRGQWGLHVCLDLIYKAL